MSKANYELWKTTPIVGEPELSVVIPTYNEVARILPTIGAITWYVSRLRPNWELIISDDGSGDNTVDTVRVLGFANMQVLTAQRHIGKGRAVQQGMLAARGRAILFCDADNATPIEELSRLLPKLEHEGYDLAIGSRPLKSAAAIKSPLMRHWQRRWRRSLIWRSFRMGIHDTQCGFKLFTRPAAQRLFQVQTIMGFAFDVEILYLALHWGFRVAEVPVGWVDTPESKFSLREFQRFLFDLPKITRNHPQDAFAFAT